MKFLIIIISMLALFFSSFAQSEIEEESSHKFRRDNVFLGGSVGLGVSNGGFSAGANPEIGYSVAQWLDAGVSTNFNYFSYRAQYNFGIRQRSFNYGAGIFARFFPFRGFFLQVLPEYNWINTTFKDLSGGSIGSEYKLKREAPSLLLGIGYGSRMIGNTNFFSVLMIDAGTNTNSPYINTYGGKLPILRTGFNFYLRPKRR